MKSIDTTDKTNDNVIELLQIINVLITEVQPHRKPKAITLDTSFEKDLGLDSLTRVELISRVEKQFKLALTEQNIAEAESVRDLLRAIQGASMPRAALHEADIQAVALDDAGADVKVTPDDSVTLIDVLNWHVSSHPDRPHIKMYTDEGDGEVISYKQLKDAAVRVAGGLQQRGLQPAEPVAIMLPSGPEYFYSFFGILLAGGIPV
ncbi:MAG: AMP-binding protein, partial [Gammaproteobacteria bacterium]|nr:AMP-binding protein [Gammaproteobacteria bacterium]